MTSAGYTLNEIIELLTVDMMRKKVVAVGGGGPIYFINIADCFFYFVGVGSFGSGFVDDLREQLSCCFCISLAQIWSKISIITYTRDFSHIFISPQFTFISKFISSSGTSLLFQ